MMRASTSGRPEPIPEQDPERRRVPPVARASERASGRSSTGTRPRRLAASGGAALAAALATIEWPLGALAASGDPIVAPLSAPLEVALGLGLIAVLIALLARQIVKGKTRERALARSEERYRRLVETIPHGITESDTSGRVTYSNPAHHTMHGYDDDEFVGRELADFFMTEEERAAFREYFATLMEEQPPPEPFFGRRKTRSGRDIDVQVDWTYKRDEAGRVTGTIGVVTDITERKRAEEARERAQSQLVDAIESMNEGFALFDAEDRFVLCNAKYRAIWAGLGDVIEPGVPFEDLVRATAERDLVRGAKDSADEWIAERLRQHLSAAGVHEHELTDGRWMQAVERKTRDGGTVCVRTDITDRKRAEETLRASEERFRDFAETASNWFWEMDENLRFNYFSDRYGWVGLEAEDQLGKTRPETTADDISQRKWRDHLADLEARRPFKDFQHTGRGRDGSITHISVSGKPIFDEAGRFEGYRGTATDITDRRRAEEALRAREAQLASISENLPGTIFRRVLHKDGRISYPYVSGGMTDVFRHDPDDLVESAETFISAIHHDDYPAWRAQVEESSRTLAPFDHELRVLTPDGSVQWLRTIARPKPLGDGDVAWDGVALNITDRKQAEEQLHQAQKMETVGQLTGGIAHDFNNLLAVVLGNLELLAEGLAPEAEEHDLVARAMIAADRGATLTSRLLAFSRKQPLQPRNIRLSGLMREMDELLRRTLGETIDLEMALSEGLWPTLVDPVQMENALLNLALNARDAMPKGGRLTIRTANAGLEERGAAQRAGVSPGEYVTLAVSDTGTGMTADVLKKAFEPFFTTKDVGAGSGLGLSMIYGFVKQSGGHVAIDTRAGEGTTVTIYLPRSQGQDANVRPLAVRRKEPGSRGESILVVEDDPEVRALTVALLLALDYDVLEAATGEAALDTLAAASGVNLLLTDAVLPGGMSGPDLVDEVARRRPEIRVLFMSGYAEEASIRRGTTQAGVDLLHKPFRKADLAHKVRDTLDRAS